MAGVGEVDAKVADGDGGVVRGGVTLMESGFDLAFVIQDLVVILFGDFGAIKESEGD